MKRGGWGQVGVGGGKRWIGNIWKPEACVEYYIKSKLLYVISSYQSNGGQLEIYTFRLQNATPLKFKIRWGFAKFGMNVPQTYTNILQDSFVDLYYTLLIITILSPQKFDFSVFNLPFLEANNSLLILKIKNKVQQKWKQSSAQPIYRVSPQFGDKRQWSSAFLKVHQNH